MTSIESALRTAALQQWPPAAEARDTATRIHGNVAEVAMTVNGNYEYWMYFRLESGVWALEHDGNGPSLIWDVERQ